jgi:hypothetical protein
MHVYIHVQLLALLMYWSPGIDHVPGGSAVDIFLTARTVLQVTDLGHHVMDCSMTNVTDMECMLCRSIPMRGGRPEPEQHDLTPPDCTWG